MRTFKVEITGLINEKFNTIANSSEEVFKKLENKYYFHGFESNGVLYVEVLNIKNK